LSVAASLPARAHAGRFSTLDVALSSAPPFFFAGPTRTLIAHDDARAVTGRLGAREQLLVAAEQALAGAHPDGAGLLVGAVPFADDAPVRLFCPTRVSRRGRWWPERSAPPSPRVQGDARAALAPADTAEGRAFIASVQKAVAAIEHGEMRKVVLARMKRLALDAPLEVSTLLHALRTQNAHGFVFALSLPDARGNDTRTLVGASPELLLSRRGKRVLSAPLAGSAKRSPDPREDRRRAEQLVRSKKDLHEHRIVVEQIADQLAPLVTDLRFERTPAVTATPAMWHLSTRIEGSLRDRDVSALRLALTLHPTPAVCGVPAKAASRYIAQSEPFDRGYFTGTLGYMDSAGDGDFIVTIRCAELLACEVRVFAGAGIVAGSDPEAELVEIEAKMQTMLAALGHGAQP
jgi:isochorismate synthase